jgi:hypothetical protein
MAMHCSTPKTNASCEEVVAVLSSREVESRVQHYENNNSVKVVHIAASHV